MKGYFIDGYINDDKTLEFEAYISVQIIISLLET